MSSKEAKESDAPLMRSDGRQSPAAAEIVRGSCRALCALGSAPVSELTLANNRRADLVALTPKGDFWIIEVKSGVNDLKSDRKWPDYRDFCDEFYFAVAPGFPLDLLPEDCGIILADRFGGEILRAAQSHRLSPARRRAMLLRFARGAALRLQAMLDPGLPPFSDDKSRAR